MTKCVIIVTYEPEKEQIKQLTACVEKAGFTPVIADNSEKHPVGAEMVSEETKLISLHGNAGIAAAQNAGVSYALEQGAEILGFLDQDSVIDETLLEVLETALDQLGECVAAPIAVEKETLKEYPVQRLGRWGYPKDLYAKGEKQPLRADLVISSGTMTRASVFRKTGGFDESLFIDFVDVEWCLRCKRAGIPVYVIPEAVLCHKIGSEEITAEGMTITVHSPVRTYYKVRNAFLMLHKKAGFVFSVRQILPALVHNFLLLFHVKNKKEYFKYYMTGIGHGILGISGRYPKGR